MSSADTVAKILHHTPQHFYYFIYFYTRLCFRVTHMCVYMHVHAHVYMYTHTEFCVELSDLQYIENNRDKIMKPGPINHARWPSDVAKSKR